MGPSNLFLSPARPKTTKSVRAKITNAVATLRHILEGRIIAFEGKQGVYFEKDGSPFFIHKNGSELSVQKGGSIDDPLIVDAITLYDLSSLSGMIEMQKGARDFLTAVHTKRSGADLMGMLYYLCDSQYFEGLKIATRDSICTYDNLQLEEIKQANEDVLSSILFLYCVNFAGNLSPRTNSERVCCCNRKAPGSSDATM